MIRSITCNPGFVVVSLLIALVGTVFAEGPLRHPRPPRDFEQRREVPEKRGPVRHDTKFRAVPGSTLEVRAIEYDGSTNGTLTVELRNRTKAAQKFSANGLYFVPEGDPDKAPQRLGAVGPMQLARAGAQEVRELVVAAGQTLEVKLDVFCIDSHRSSPSPQNVFHVGATKLPKELTRTIERSADHEVNAKRLAGEKAPRPAAKGEIQRKVWETRDKDWVELDGEGAQEATK